MRAGSTTKKLHIYTNDHNDDFSALCGASDDDGSLSMAFQEEALDDLKQYGKLGKAYCVGCASALCVNCHRFSWDHQGQKCLFSPTEFKGCK